MRARQLRILLKAVGRAAALGAALAVVPALAAAAPDPVALRIELRPEVEVKGRQVLLGDVAALSTLDVGTLERLMSLPLGPAPVTGSALRVERGPLLRWIRARTGLRPDQIAWAGADSTLVRAAEETVSGDALAACAAAALAAAAGRGAGPLVPERPRDVMVPAGAAELRARRLGRSALLSSRPAVWVEVWVDGRFARTVPVVFDRAAPPLPGSAPVPALASAPLPAASRAEPAVRRGGAATLHSAVGRIALERSVVALEDGRPGDVVRVTAARVEAPFRARVVGPGSVEVEP